MLLILLLPKSLEPILVTQTGWLPKSKSAQQQTCFCVMSSIHPSFKSGPVTVIRAARVQGMHMQTSHGHHSGRFHCAHAHTFLSRAHLPTITINPRSADRQLQDHYQLVEGCKQKAPCGPGPMPGCNCRHTAPDPNTILPQKTPNPYPRAPEECTEKTMSQNSHASKTCR